MNEKLSDLRGKSEGFFYFRLASRIWTFPKRIRLLATLLVTENRRKNARKLNFPLVPLRRVGEGSLPPFLSNARRIPIKIIK